MTQNDFELLYQVACDPLIWEQHPIRNRYEREVFKLFFDGAVTSETAFLIRDNSSGEIIGSTRYYDYNPEQSSIAIGYTFLARQFWGGRYNKEIKKLMLDHAFQFVSKVYFHIAAGNVRSQIAMGNIGGKKTREVNFELDGQKILHYEYVISKFIKE